MNTCNVFAKRDIFKKNTCALTSQQKFWHKWDLKNVYNFFFLKQYQSTSNIYTFKELINVRITLQYCLVYIDMTFVMFEIGQELHSKYHNNLINRM